MTEGQNDSLNTSSVKPFHGLNMTEGQNDSLNTSSVKPFHGLNMTEGQNDSLNTSSVKPFQGLRSMKFDVQICFLFYNCIFDFLNSETSGNFVHNLDTLNLYIRLQKANVPFYTH